MKIAKRIKNKAAKLVSEVASLYELTGTQPGDFIDLYDENRDLFEVKNFQFDEEKGVFSWIEKSMLHQEHTETEGFIYAADENYFDENDFNEFCRYWKGYIRRTKKYFSMPLEELERVFDPENEDQEEETTEENED